MPYTLFSWRVQAISSLIVFTFLDFCNPLTPSFSPLPSSTEFYQQRNVIGLASPNTPQSAVRQLTTGPLGVDDSWWCHWQLPVLCWPADWWATCSAVQLMGGGGTSTADWGSHILSLPVHCVLTWKWLSRICKSVFTPPLHQVGQEACPS